MIIIHILMINKRIIVATDKNFRNEPSNFLSNCRQLENTYVSSCIFSNLIFIANRTDSNGSDGDEGGTGGSGTSGGKGGDGGTGAGKGTGGSGKDRTNAGGSVNGGSYDGGKLMMPYIQLGLGIGFGPVGGCIFNSPWPCIQQTSVIT